MRYLIFGCNAETRETFLETTTNSLNKAITIADKLSSLSNVRSAWVLDDRKPPDEDMVHYTQHRKGGG